MLRFCRANPPMSPQNGREKNKAQILDLVYITSLTSSPTTFPFCLSMSTLLASYFLNAPSQTLCTFCSLFLECSFSRYLVVCSLISFGLWSNVTLLERSSFSPNSIPFLSLFYFRNYLKLNDKLQKELFFPELFESKLPTWWPPTLKYLSLEVVKGEHFPIQLSIHFPIHSHQNGELTLLHYCYLVFKPNSNFANCPNNILYSQKILYRILPCSHLSYVFRLLQCRTVLQSFSDFHDFDTFEKYRQWSL